MTKPTTHVHVIGPNLRDRDFTFHVHAEGCADVKRSRLYRGHEHAYDCANTYALRSKRAVVEHCYSDQIHSDNANDPVWGVWTAYEPDFKWFDCLGNFPDTAKNDGHELASSTNSTTQPQEGTTMTTTKNPTKAELIKQAKALGLTVTAKMTVGTITEAIEREQSLAAQMADAKKNRREGLTPEELEARRQEVAPLQELCATRYMEALRDGTNEDIDLDDAGLHMTKEWANLTAWLRGGRKGTMPAAPYYDAFVGETYLVQHGHKPAVRKATRKTATRAHTPAVDGEVRWYRNGKPVGDSVNKLRCIAWNSTAQIGGADVKRLSPDDFRALLAELGVAEPETTTWSVTLPNGVVVGAVRNGDEPPAAAQPAEKPATVKAVRDTEQVTPRPKRERKSAAPKAASKKATTKSAPRKTSARKAA